MEELVSTYKPTLRGHQISSCISDRALKASWADLWTDNSCCPQSEVDFSAWKSFCVLISTGTPRPVYLRRKECSWSVFLSRRTSMRRMEQPHWFIALVIMIRNQLTIREVNVARECDTFKCDIKLKMSEWWIERVQLSHRTEITCFCTKIVAVLEYLYPNTFFRV